MSPYLIATVNWNKLKQDVTKCLKQLIIVLHDRLKQLSVVHKINFPENELFSGIKRQEEWIKMKMVAWRICKLLDFSIFQKFEDLKNLSNHN